MARSFNSVPLAATEKIVVACAACGRQTNHAILQATEEKGSDPTDDGHNSFDCHAEYQIIQCGGCDTVSFRKENSNSEDTDPDGEWIVHEDLYPSRINNWQLIEDYHLLPNDLRRIYQETVSALNNDLPILSGIGIRAIIETVSKEKQAAGNNLARKIDDLVAKGVLTTDGATILHKIRALGNEAAHSVKAHTATEMKVAMEVVEHLLQAAYIIPYNATQTFK